MNSEYQMKRDILAPLALGDELRAALITGGVCWGFLCLHLGQSSPAFTPAETAFLGHLTPYMAEGLRNTLLLGSPTDSVVSDEPGLLLLGDNLSIIALIAVTPAAERWLAEVAESDWPRQQLFLPSLPVCKPLSKILTRYRI